MLGLNKVMLIGNLGNEPEYRHLEGGATVAYFSLATSEFYKNKKGVKTELVEWHRIVMWRELAELAERLKLHKGQQVFIEGKLRYRKWEKDGNNKMEADIVADNIILIGKNDISKDSSKIEDVINYTMQKIAPIIKPDGDLPF